MNQPKATFATIALRVVIHQMALACVFLFGGTAVGGPVITSFVDLGKHPDAVLQPTATGATLHTLETAGGNVYIGYGDFSINTGPIAMRYFDPVLDAYSSSLITVNTEAIHRIKVIGNEIWATTADPLGLGSGGYVKGPVGGGTWSEVNSLAALHLFDIASFGGNAQHLFLSGSGGPTNTSNSIVYASTDGGSNWSVSLDLARPASVPTWMFTRFYGIGELNNNLYVQHSLLGQGFVPLDMYRFDGSSWTSQAAPTTPGGQAIRFIDPDPFAGEIVVRGDHSGLSASPTYRFDGTSLSEINVQGQSGQLTFWDHHVSGNTLYLLTDEQSVISTTDFLNWSTVATGLPATVQSLAVNGGHIYFGASDSTLYRTATAIPEPSACLLLLFVCVGTGLANRGCRAFTLWTRGIGAGAGRC